ncbi:MAG: NAD-dependent epimerase/dehydratase family protein [Planctomycetaceae bacterium]
MGNHVVIAGGSGFLGISLAHYLAEQGISVVLLSRRAPRVQGPWQHVPWDARSLGAWTEHLEEAMGLVNLTGRSVDCIKTPDHQDEILRSRVESTRVLGAAVRKLQSPPPVWVQMSTAHIYGDPPKFSARRTPPWDMDWLRLSARPGKRNFETRCCPHCGGLYCVPAS